MWMNACRQLVKHIEPSGVSDRKIVTYTTGRTGPENGTGLALAFFFTNPPPKIFWANQFERPGHRSLFHPVRRDSVSIALKNCGTLACICDKKLYIAWLVEAPDRVPLPLHDEHIFRTAVRTASIP